MMRLHDLNDGLPIYLNPLQVVGIREWRRAHPVTDINKTKTIVDLVGVGEDNVGLFCEVREGSEEAAEEWARALEDN